MPGLSEATITRYTPIVSAFLAECFPAGISDFYQMSAGDITAFVKHQAERTTAKHATIVGSALRFVRVFARHWSATDPRTEIPPAAAARRPRCLAGRAATPPEECGGPRGYMRILDQHKYYPPMAEQELVEKALQRIAGVLPDRSHRDLLKELLDQGLERAVQRLKEYAQFQPDRFSLQEVNDRLVRFCPYGRAS